MAAGLRPTEVTMTMAVGIVLGLVLVLIAAVSLSPSLVLLCQIWQRCFGINGLGCTRGIH